MKKLWMLFVFFLVISLPSRSLKAQEEPREEDNSKISVTVIQLDGTINPATSLYIQNGLKQADDMLILKLNTPGGLLSATRDIVQAFLESEIPVVVYVSPKGGQAASAGMFITMAAHVAAMAPATNIGAASPVHMNQGQESEETENTKTLARKAMHDTAAFARSIAKDRGRNEEWAEQAVREAVSVTADEAVENQIVNFMANDLHELMQKMNGFVVKLPSGETRLQTSNYQFNYVKMGAKEFLLDLISNPNVAYILMIIGFYGIYFELSNPGSLFPGIVGGICLILGFFAMQTLPLNVAGIALLVLGLVLFALETQITSGGLLAVGGVVSFTLGSFMLFDAEASFPALRVSLSVILPVVLLTCLFFFVAIGKVLQAQKSKAHTGLEGLVGEEGVVCDELTPAGQIEVHGEIWNATSTVSPVSINKTVKIIKIKGLTCVVEPVDKL